MSKKKPEHLGGAAVVIGEEHTSFPFVKFIRKHTGKRARFLGFILAVFLIIGVVLFVTVQHFRSNSASKQEVSNACSEPSNPILKQATAAFLPGQHVKFQQAVQTIMKTNNFQDDPNCLYVVVVYDLSVGNSRAASYYFSVLQKVYDPSRGLNPIFGKNITPASLEPSVTALAKTSQVSAQ